MKDLPILKYNDLREVMWLDHHNCLNGTVVDDASLKVMLRIEKLMSRLDVVGDDEGWSELIDLRWRRKSKVKRLHQLHPLP